MSGSVLSAEITGPVTAFGENGRSGPHVTSRGDASELVGVGTTGATGEGDEAARDEPPQPVAATAITIGAHHIRGRIVIPRFAR
jgi:hypothetical protein